MEIQELKKEIEDCSQWMADATIPHTDGGLEAVKKEIEDLAKNCGDIYEVVAEIHLVNGEKITLHNHCTKCYIYEKYLGDTMYFPFLDVEKTSNILYVDRYDDHMFFHQTRIPIESICYIDSWNEFINWEMFKERILKEIEKNNASIEN